jgi:hypothetical protein
VSSVFEWLISAESFIEPLIGYDRGPEMDFGDSGGSDGTRTRGFLRDRQAFLKRNNSLWLGGHGCNLDLVAEVV